MQETPITLLDALVKHAKVLSAHIHSEDEQAIKRFLPCFDYLVEGIELRLKEEKNEKYEYLCFDRDTKETHYAVMVDYKDKTVVLANGMEYQFSEVHFTRNPFFRSL